MPRHTHRKPSGALSRRAFVTGAGLGLAAAVSPGAPSARDAPTPDGTPEQIHLAWGEEPASSVCVSWACAAQALNARVELQPRSGRPRTIHAVQRTYTDGV